MFQNLYPEMIALTQVIFINVVLSGDNAIVVGMAAANVHHSIRKKVILWGIGGAVVLRIIFALIATKLLSVVGLTLAGGVLLLWVCWKMYREMTETVEEEEAAVTLAEETLAEGAPAEVATAAGGAVAAGAVISEATAHGGTSFTDAMMQIVIADVSMSLDNVLAVAGAAKEHLWILVVGLVLSVALMGAAASLIAHLLTRYRWIAWLGFAVILYVAVDMVWRGSYEVACNGTVDAVCGQGMGHYLKARMFGV
ncbi:TerC family protein [Prosthecomicrobium sp. N25]|uniref:TerC family protein n=1 Tax=Prosthecomicrobium sp. N25 TaxID=3129254 RepID=UPI003077693E